MNAQMGNRFGVSVDRSIAVRLSCCGDQKTYQSSLSAAKSLLGISNTLSIKDICTQSGVSQCLERANGILSR
jgi:hypothetical protein